MIGATDTGIIRADAEYADEMAILWSREPVGDKVVDGVCGDIAERWARYAAYARKALHPPQREIAELRAEVERLKGVQA